MAGKAYFNNKQQVTTAFYNGILISKGYSNEVVTFDGNLVTLTINPTPSDATITFSNYGIGEISSDGKSIRIKKGSSVTYSVNKTDYITQSNTITVNNDQTLNIELQLNLVTLTVNTTPSDAIVTFSTGTVNDHSVTVLCNTTVTYTISKTGYITSQAYSKTVTQTESINAPALDIAPYNPGDVLFESSTPGSYTLTPLANGTYNVICVGGGGGGAAISIHESTSYTIVTASGGSGGYTNKNISLNKTNYTIQVGSGGTGNSVCELHNKKPYDTVNVSGVNGGNSSVGSIVSVTGGTGGNGWAKEPGKTGGAFSGTGGSGETSSGNGGKTSIDYASVHLSSTRTSLGGNSVYSNRGTGGSATAVSFTSASATNGSSGYVKVTFVSY